MNEKLKTKLIEKLKNIITQLEDGTSLVKEISFEYHYDSILVGETGRFIHQYTGDSQIVIRCKNISNKLKRGVVSVSDLDGPRDAK